MDLTTLRDTFIKKKTENERDMQNLALTVDKIKDIIDNLDDQLIVSARDRGIPIDTILNLDYERMKSDNKYLLECKTNIKNLFNEIKERLTALL